MVLLVPAAGQWDNEGMSKPPAKLPSIPDQKLKSALVGKDLSGVRIALEEGACPDGDGVFIDKDASFVHAPLEFSIKQHHPKAFVEALLAAGAYANEIRHNGRLKVASPLAVALEVGNEPAVGCLLATRDGFDVNPLEWRACMASRKPARWIKRLLDHGALPPQTTALGMLGAASAMGNDTVMDILLRAVPLPEHWIVSEPIMEGALKRPLGFRKLLLRALKDDPCMLEKLHSSGEGVLPSFIKVRGRPTPQAMSQMLAISELSGEIGMRWNGEGVLQLMIKHSEATRNMYRVALDAGARFPVVDGAEDMIHYLDRVAPRMMAQARSPIDNSFKPEMEAWLDVLWADIQADQMSTNVSPAPSRPSRRI